MQIYIISLFDYLVDSTNFMYDSIFYYNTGGSSPELWIHPSITPTITYCNIEGGAFEGTGNIKNDPKLIMYNDIRI